MSLFSSRRDGLFSRPANIDRMATVPPALGRRAERIASSRSRGGRGTRMLAWLLGGGTDGNQQLTAMTGVVLLVLLAVIGVTILRKSQLISVHLFVGLLLLGPVALKMASTGYRFVRYYTHNAAYRREGAPLLPLRLIAPMVVVTTVVVFASGIVLLFNGPAHRGAWTSIHKVSFILWLGFTGLHVLGHLTEMPASLRAARAERALLGSLPRGAGGRWIATLGFLAAGLVLALVLIPQFSPWTAAGAFAHHHH
jgi:hypothetical protein